MNTEHWTTRTWLYLVFLLVSIILFGTGFIGGQSLLGTKVQENKETITSNTTEIEHVKETHIEKLERIETVQKIQGEKLDDISTAITAIQTTLSNR